MTDAWRVLASRTEYETGWYTGGYDLVEQPDGSEKRYYWAALAPAVVVVAVDGGDVVLVDQYRPTIREQCLELPAGIVERVDDGDDRAAGRTGDGATGDENGDVAGPRPAPDREPYTVAGARELAEETGYAAGEVRLVEEFWCATGVLRHRRGIVFARDLERVGRDLDDNEFLAVECVPVEDALAVAREPPANDATIEALLLAAADGHLDR